MTSVVNTDQPKFTDPERHLGDLIETLRARSDGTWDVRDVHTILDVKKDADIIAISGAYAQKASRIGGLKISEEERLALQEQLYAAKLIVSSPELQKAIVKHDLKDAAGLMLIATPDITELAKVLRGGENFVSSRAGVYGVLNIPATADQAAIELAYNTRKKELGVITSKGTRERMTSQLEVARFIALSPELKNALSALEPQAIGDFTQAQQAKRINQPDPRLV